MYSTLVIAVSIISTFVLTWIFAKLKIFDLIAYFAPIRAGLGLFRVFEVLGLFILSFFLFQSVFGGIADEHDYTYTYLTSRLEVTAFEYLNRSDKKEFCGMGERRVPADTVLKVINIETDDTYKWIESYILVEGRLKKVYARFYKKGIEKLKENNAYWWFNRTSRSFEAYHERAVIENERITARLQSEFAEELEKQEIFINCYDGNFFKKLWLRITKFCIPGDGYDYKSSYGHEYKGVFGNFPTADGQLWYTDSKNKKQFKELVEQFYKKLDEQLYALPVADW
ncbi:hypothetical protein [Treponema zioleckii]|uniref:hypothetical protein n=1 Tax=Treponema zioleckii TaxID=331680 RepID=UPI00168A9835|nr:hypothetical protein [Treponema zioleckii]